MDAKLRLLISQYGRSRDPELAIKIANILARTVDIEEPVTVYSIKQTWTGDQRAWLFFDKTTAPAFGASLCVAEVEDDMEDGRKTKWGKLIKQGKFGQVINEFNASMMTEIHIGLHELVVN